MDGRQDARSRQTRGALKRLLPVVALVTLVLLSGCRLTSWGGAGSPTPTVAATQASTPEPRATPSAVVTATQASTDGVTVLEAPAVPADARPTGEQRLTLAGPVDGPTTLDPPKIRDVGSAFIARQVFRGLVRLDGELTPVPDLARRIEISRDGLTYRFQLWEDLRFADGRPITADDVRFSLERATDPALEGGDGASLAAQTYLADIVGATERMRGSGEPLSGVQVEDARTVTIRLVEPARDFLIKLAATPAFIVDRENVASGSEWWRSPNGSGPFALERWTPQQQITLRGNDGYRPHPPMLETVDILLGANAVRPLALYERGQVDLAEVAPASVDRLEAANSPYREHLVVTPSFGASYVVFNPNIPPFDDLNLRRALLQSFDRQKIANVSFEGRVRQADGIVPPGMAGRDWAADVPPYDLAAGRALLEQAVGADGSPVLTFYTMGDFVTVAMKRVYERDLGVTVDVVALDWPDYLRQLSARRLPAFMLSWVADYPDPGAFLRILFHSQSPENYIGYANPEVDRLLDQAEVEPDGERRLDLYRQAQQAIIDDAVLVPLYFVETYMLVQPHVHGVTMTPMGILGLESVWITT